MTSISLPIAGFMGLGGPEVLIILAIILIFFGGRKLPELAKGLGKSIKEFKKASNEADEEIEAATQAKTAAAKPAEAVKAEAAKPEATKPHGTS